MCRHWMRIWIWVAIAEKLQNSIKRKVFSWHPFNKALPYVKVHTGPYKVVKCPKCCKLHMRYSLQMLNRMWFSNEEFSLDISKDVPNAPWYFVLPTCLSLSKHLQSSLQYNVSKPADILIRYLCQTLRICGFVPGEQGMWVVSLNRVVLSTRSVCQSFFFQTVHPDSGVWAHQRAVEPSGAQAWGQHGQNLLQGLLSCRQDIYAHPGPQL